MTIEEKIKEALKLAENLSVSKELRFSIYNDDLYFGFEDADQYNGESLEDSLNEAIQDLKEYQKELEEMF